MIALKIDPIGNYNKRRQRLDDHEIVKINKY